MAVVLKNMSTSCYRNVTHCIFDMDGLLLDTEPIYTKVAQKMLEPYGKVYTWERKQTLMGLQSADFAKQIVKMYGLPITWQEYAAKQNLLVAELLTAARIQLMPGARRLLCHLHCYKVPFAMATSNRLERFNVKTRNYQDLFDLFSHYVCGSSDNEVKAGKPAPDIFLVAASRFADKPDACKCLVFEDAPNGVQAAISAGMQCVMVPDERMSTELSSKATLALKSLQDFQPELFGLPSFSKICC